MNSTSRILALAAICLIAVVAFLAWPQKGPAEKAGSAIDQTAQDLKDAVDPPGPMEKAGRAVDDAVKK